MGAASRGGSPSGSALGGAGCVLEIRHPQHALGTNVQPGTGGWTGGTAMVRYGGVSATLPGVNGWENGSGGATPTRGYIAPASLGAAYKRATNGAAGSTPIDWYCGVMMAPRVVKPPADIPTAFQVWEFGAEIVLSALPVGAITRDMGLVCMMAAVTGYANCLRAGVAAGNDFAGFGLGFDSTDGSLLFFVKKSGAFGGAALSYSKSLGVYGALRPIAAKFRLHGATRTSEARLEVYVDGLLVDTQYWGAGTILPVAADSTYTQQIGAFRPMLRAAQLNTNACELYWRDEYVKAAPSVGLLD